MQAVSYLTQPEYTPFAVALAMMLMLGVLEAVGFGLSLAADAVGLDLSADLDGDGQPDIAAGPLGWLGFGKVPLGVLLVTFLSTFGLLGVLLQRTLTHYLGAPTEAVVAAGVVTVPALLLNGFVAAVLARILPKDETTAVSMDTFVGKRARMLDVAAGPGRPARAVHTDTHGQQHYVSVLPHDGLATLLPGDEILLVRRAGVQFWALSPGSLDNYTPTGG